MPVPDSRYLRPTVSPVTFQSQQRFAQCCSSGDLEKVSEIVESEPYSPEFLIQELSAAIYKHDLRMIEFLFKKGANIDSQILNAAASVKVLPVFQLLLDHGWDINAPILGNETTLL